MPLSTGNKIKSQDYDQVYNSIFDLMGTTSTGYGAIMLSEPVVPGERVEALQIDQLRLDIERAIVHQNGTGTFIGIDVTPDVPVNNTATTYLVNFLEADPGEDITGNMLARLYTQLQFLSMYPTRAHPSQLETLSFNNSVPSPVSWTCTNYSSTATMILNPNNSGYMTTVNWSWFTPQQVQYFFNLGGSIEPDIEIVSGRINDITAWQPLIDAVNTIRFDLDKFNEAKNNGNQYKYIISGSGAYLLEGARAVTHVPVVITTEVDTQIYAANAIILTFTLNGSQISGSLTFVAGVGKKGKKKKKIGKIFSKKKIFDIYDKTILGRYIRVSLKLITDYKTTVPVSHNGGISAQLPQTMLIGNYLSATPRPIPQFSTYVGGVTDSQTVTLLNNSALTCTVSDVVLSGYSYGTVSETQFVIPPYGSHTFTVQYNGTVAGVHRGYIDVLCNINRLTLFTEVIIGGTTPSSWTVTTTTNALLSQEFVVDHAGGNFRRFNATLNVTYPGMQGYSLLEHVPDTLDKFRVDFDPGGMENGIYPAEVQVDVEPLDSSEDPVTFLVPLNINLNVENRNISTWISAMFYDGVKLGLSYDVIGGFRYLTIGIGRSNPQVSELGTVETFNSWSEVYRVPVNKDVEDTLYPKDYLVKGPDVFNKKFGVGTSRGNLITVKNWHGNLQLLLNTPSDYGSTDTERKVLTGLATAFYYYAEKSNRLTQLETDDLQVGNHRGTTNYLVGFGREGQIVTHYVPIIFENI